MSPKFSVIMPSFLGEYSRAAQNREEKIVRSIDSCLDQMDFELIIVADGCQKTVDIVTDKFKGEKDVKLFYIQPRKVRGRKRNAGSSGTVRNAGLQQAKGEYAIYLDIDDVYLDGYLESLKKEMTDHDWYWFDDMSWNVNTKKFDRHGINIHGEGLCGTSNICHKLSMNARWNDHGYLHDWYFINSLKAISENYKKLNTAGYGICHVPGLLDV